MSPGPVWMPKGWKPAKRPWSNAVRTRCDCGRLHASKMEARVCAAVRAELLPHQTLFAQVRLPLFTLAPDPSGRAALYVTIDFVVWDRSLCRIARLIDAKSPTRVSRDWRRGAAAAEGTYEVRVEERDR